jgi:prepilin-type N-terminal cleavage/methylation domain-containing protein
MNPRTSRLGFTLVELMVAVVIGGVLMTAVYQVLVTNQRISAVQAEQILAQQTLRGGVDLLTQELREVSAQGGDLLTAEDDAFSIRALRTFGIACVIDPPQVRVAVEGRPFTGARPSMYIFADGDPNTAADDVWYRVTLNELPQPQTCPGDRPARRLVIQGLSGDQWAGVLPGAPVRAYETVRYHLGERAGESYLMRTIGDVTVPLVGPLTAGEGLAFDYLDQDGAATSTLTEVRQIRITIRSDSEARDTQGRQVAAALSVTVFLRN